MQEKEINLIDLIVEVLLCWRMFIVWMFCGAVLFSGFNYVRTWQSANAQAAQVEEAKRQLEEAERQLEEAERQLEEEASENMQAELVPVDPELLQQLMDQLDDDQLRNVEYVLAYEELYRERLFYQEQSIWMHMDAYNVQKAVVSVWITSESDEKIFAIEAAYEDTVRGGRMIQYVAEQLGMTVSSVSELVSLSHKTSGVTSIGGNDDFTLTIIHYDEQVCRNMVQAIIEFMENEQDDLETVFGEFEAVIVVQEPATAYYPSVITDQKSFLTDIISIQDTIAKRIKDFTDEQNLYHDAVAKGKIFVLNSEESDSEESDSVGIIDIESLEEIVERGVTVTPGISAKYVLLGMVMAAFVYAFYIFVIYVLNTRIRITDNLLQLYKIPQLGQISGKKEEKKLLNFIDKWILSLRNRNKRKFTREEAMKLATVAVKMSAERNSVSSVYLIGCDLKEQVLAVCEQIKESLNQSNLQVHILSNVLYDAQAMSNLENAQGVVLVEQAGSTLYDEINQELLLLNRQGIKVLGGIIVE